MAETNGAAPPLALPGRLAPAYPSMTLPSGYTVTVRRLAAGLAAQLNAKAYQELEAERPAPPVQVVAVGPGERPGEPEQTRAIANTSDPDYQAALAAWTARVQQAGAMKLLKVIADYALLTPTDDEAVAAYRAMLAAAGVETSDSDREIFVWSILAPAPGDVQALIGFVLGISEAQQEAIKAQKATFRGDVSG